MLPFKSESLLLILVDLHVCYIHDFWATILYLRIIKENFSFQSLSFFVRVWCQGRQSEMELECFSKFVKQCIYWFMTGMVAKLGWMVLRESRLGARCLLIIGNLWSEVVWCKVPKSSNIVIAKLERRGGPGLNLVVSLSSGRTQLGLDFLLVSSSLSS